MFGWSFHKLDDLFPNTYLLSLQIDYTDYIVLKALDSSIESVFFSPLKLLSSGEVRYVPSVCCVIAIEVCCVEQKESRGERPPKQFRSWPRRPGSWSGLCQGWGAVNGEICGQVESDTRKLKVWGCSRMSESCKAEVWVAEKVLKEEGEQWCQTEQQQEPPREWVCKPSQWGRLCPWNGWRVIKRCWEVE